MILAAIFDLDDTLYLERQYVRSGYAAVAEYLQSKMGTGTDSAKMGTGSDSAVWNPCLSPFLPLSADKLLQWLWSRFERGQAAGAFDDLNREFFLQPHAG